MKSPATTFAVFVLGLSALSASAAPVAGAVAKQVVNPGSYGINSESITPYTAYAAAPSTAHDHAHARQGTGSFAIDSESVGQAQSEPAHKHAHQVIGSKSIDADSESIRTRS